MKYINVLEQYSRRINRTKDQLTNVRNFYATKTERQYIEEITKSLTDAKAKLERLIVQVNKDERHNVEIKNNPQVIDGNEIS